MNIYNYHPQTRQFVSVSEADPDPMDEGNWLIPAHATTAAVPVTPETHVAIFSPDTETWTLVIADSVTEATEQPPTLDAQRLALATRIYGDVDALTFLAVGNRTQEYLTAEQEAMAFALDDYQGDPPESVASAAEAFGYTLQEAADDILTQAQKWRGAQALMRRKRLWYRTRVLQADESQLMVLAGEWAQFVEEMKVLLAGV